MDHSAHIKKIIKLWYIIIHIAQYLFEGSVRKPLMNSKFFVHTNARDIIYMYIVFRFRGLKNTWQHCMFYGHSSNRLQLIVSYPVLVFIWISIASVQYFGQPWLVSSFPMRGLAIRLIVSYKFLRTLTWISSATSKFWNQDYLNLNTKKTKK